MNAVIRMDDSPKSQRGLAHMALATGITLAALVLGSSYAAAQSCEDLWYQRNSIYKAAGYCFKTSRAIATFGNAGCLYDVEAALPLSPRARARIDSIVRQERYLGCR